MLAEQAASYSLLGGGGGAGASAVPGKWAPGIGGGQPLAIEHGGAGFEGFGRSAAGGGADEGGGFGRRGNGARLIEDAAAAGVLGRRPPGGRAGAAAPVPLDSGSDGRDLDDGGVNSSFSGHGSVKFGASLGVGSNPDRRRARGQGGRDVSETDDQGQCGGAWAAV
jgi:hypothetical protein